MAPKTLPERAVAEMPWRAVVDHEPEPWFTLDGVKGADCRDRLDCGHVIAHRMGDYAKKRRCYLCPRDAEQEAQP